MNRQIHGQKPPHSVIRLTLEDGRVIPFHNDEESLDTEGMLCSLFLGETSAREGEPVTADWEGEENYICLHEEIWPENEKHYVKVIKAEWSFASTAPFVEQNSFKEYIEDWMNENEQGIQGIFHLLREGISYGPPALTNNPTKILKDNLADIEAITNELCEDMGIDFWCVFQDRFDKTWNIELEKLAVIAFEETVRRQALYEVGIEW